MYSFMRIFADLGPVCLPLSRSLDTSCPVAHLSPITPPHNLSKLINKSKPFRRMTLRSCLTMPRSSAKAEWIQRKCDSLKPQLNSLVGNVSVYCIGSYRPSEMVCFFKIASSSVASRWNVIQTCSHPTDTDVWVKVCCSDTTWLHHTQTHALLPCCPHDGHSHNGWHASQRDCA